MASSMDGHGDCVTAYLAYRAVGSVVVKVTRHSCGHEETEPVYQALDNIEAKFVAKAMAERWSLFNDGAAQSAILRTWPAEFAVQRANPVPA
jgi:hypothetical protein